MEAPTAELILRAEASFAISCRPCLWPLEGRKMAEAIVTLKLTKPEALALLKAAKTGVAVIEALALTVGGVSSLSGLRHPSRADPLDAVR